MSQENQSNQVKDNPIIQSQNNPLKDLIKENFQSEDQQIQSENHQNYQISSKQDSDQKDQIIQLNMIQSQNSQNCEIESKKPNFKNKRDSQLSKYQKQNIEVMKNIIQPIQELKPSNSVTQTQNNCINLSNSNLSIEPKHNSQNEHLQYQGQILTFQKTRNQIKGIQPSKKLTGKGAVKDMRQMLQEKDKFNPNLHRNYRKYQELEYTVELCSRFEWWEKLQTSNRQIPIKLMTGQVFWFLLCAQFYPRNLIYQDIDYHQYILEKVNSFQPLVKIRLSSQFINGLKIRQKNQQLQLQKQNSLKDEKQIYNQNSNEISLNNELQLNQSESERMQPKIVPKYQYFKENEVEQQLNQISEQYNIDDYVKNLPQYKNTIFKQAYSIEDELFILSTRKYMFDYYNQNVQDIRTDKNVEKQEELLQELKDMNLDTLINIYSTDLKNIQEQNSEMLFQLSEKVQQETYYERQFPKIQDIDFSDPLVDLQILSTEEKEYLEILEIIQQSRDIDPQQLVKIGIIGKIGKISGRNESQLVDEFGLNQKFLNTAGKKNKGKKTSKKSISTVSKNKQNDQQQKDKNEDQEEEEFEEYDFKCQICNDGNSEDDNLIVFCSKCNISVHQRCYGISKIPEEDWICELCQAFGPQGKLLKCPLCTQRGGAMKPSKLNIDNQMFAETNPSYYNFENPQLLPKDFKNKKQKYLPRKASNGQFISKKQIQKNLLLQNKEKNSEENQEEGQLNLYYDFHKEKNKKITIQDLQNEPRPFQIWCHITCVIWTPESYFEDRNSYNLIKGLNDIDKKRYQLECSVCHKRAGACVQCPRNKCIEAFHPECARREGKFLETKENEKHQFLIYCDIHVPLKLKRQLEQMERKYKEDLVKFAKSIEKYYEAYLNELRKEFKVQTKGLQKIKGKDSINDDKAFIKTICDYVTYTPNKNFTITLQKLPYHEKFKLLNIQKPKNFNPHNFISRYDDMWYHIQFHDMKPEQLYKRYRKIFQNKRQELSKGFEEYFKHLKKEQQLQKKKKQEQKMLQKKIQIQKMKIQREQERELKKRKKEEQKQQKTQKKKQLKKAYQQQYLYYLSKGKKITKQEKKKQKKLEKYFKKLQSKGYVLDFLQQAQVQQPDEYVDNNLYCICRQKYNEGELMMECARCQEWFHFQCIGFKGTQEQAETIDYICKECSKQDTEEDLMKRKIIYKQWFDERYFDLQVQQQNKYEDDSGSDIDSFDSDDEIEGSQPHKKVKKNNQDDEEQEDEGDESQINDIITEDKDNDDEEYEEENDNYEYGESEHDDLLNSELNEQLSESSEDEHESANHIKVYQIQNNNNNNFRNNQSQYNIDSNNHQINQQQSSNLQFVNNNQYNQSTKITLQQNPNIVLTNNNTNNLNNNNYTTLNEENSQGSCLPFLNQGRKKFSTDILSNKEESLDKNRSQNLMMQQQQSTLQNQNSHHYQNQQQNQFSQQIQNQSQFNLNNNIKNQESDQINQYQSYSPQKSQMQMSQSAKLCQSDSQSRKNSNSKKQLKISDYFQTNQEQKDHIKVDNQKNQNLNKETQNIQNSHQLIPFLNQNNRFKSKNEVQLSSNNQQISNNVMNIHQSQMNQNCEQQDQQFKQLDDADTFQQQKQQENTQKIKNEQQNQQNKNIESNFQQIQIENSIEQTNCQEKQIEEENEQKFAQKKKSYENIQDDLQEDKKQEANDEQSKNLVYSCNIKQQKDNNEINQSQNIQYEQSNQQNVSQLNQEEQKCLHNEFQERSNAQQINESLILQQNEIQINYQQEDSSNVQNTIQKQMENQQNNQTENKKDDIENYQIQLQQKNEVNLDQHQYKLNNQQSEPSQK